MFKRIRQVYLDNNATTPVARQVRRRMAEVLDKHPGNPSSAYHRDRNILIVCSTGVDASIVAYAMKARGFPQVGVLLGGLVAWRVTHPALYRERAGSRVVTVS